MTLAIGEGQRGNIELLRDLNNNPYDRQSLDMVMGAFDAFLSPMEYAREFGARVHCAYNTVLAADYAYNHKNSVDQNPDFIHKRDIVSASEILSEDWVRRHIPLRLGGLCFNDYEIDLLEDISATTIGASVANHSFRRLSTLFECLESSYAALRNKLDSMQQRA